MSLYPSLMAPVGIQARPPPALQTALQSSDRDGPGPPSTHIPSVQFPAPLDMNNSQEEAPTGLLPGKRAGDLLAYRRF